MSIIEEKLKASAEHADILSQVCAVLDRRKVSYDASQAEILIHKGEKKEITRYIESLPIENELIWTILECVQVKKKVYIRQKIS